MQDLEEHRKQETQNLRENYKQQIDELIKIDGLSQQQPKGMGFKETIQRCLQNKQTNSD
jgi:hypothetical protein